MRFLVGIVVAIAAVLGPVSPALASGPALTHQTKLEASPEEAGDLVGQAVAVSGTTLIVGAPTPGTQPGKAHIFMRNGAAWSPRRTRP
jgi:hypothetical protein